MALDLVYPCAVRSATQCDKVNGNSTAKTKTKGARLPVSPGQAEGGHYDGKDEQGATATASESGRYQMATAAGWLLHETPGADYLLLPLT
jgi:hypothetical protein